MPPSSTASSRRRFRMLRSCSRTAASRRSFRAGAQPAIGDAENDRSRRRVPDARPVGRAHPPGLLPSLADMPLADQVTLFGHRLTRRCSSRASSAFAAPARTTTWTSRGSARSIRASTSARASSRAAISSRRPAVTSSPRATRSKATARTASSRRSASRSRTASTTSSSTSRAASWARRGTCTGTRSCWTTSSRPRSTSASSASSR